MKTLEKFIINLCGTFNNKEQIENELRDGNVIHPKAKHINAIANEKIANLPSYFKGYFILEESYYDVNGKTNVMPHLFLFTLNDEKKVTLTSYEIPEGISKEDFRNDNKDLKMDFKKLKVSEKFTPLIYTEIEDNKFVGESTSEFSPVTTFKLKETVSSDSLEVSECFYNNGKLTFGFVDPIIYKRL